MKKFERFIIYPMLFIALFFIFTDDDIQQTTAQQIYDEIIAKNIKIVDNDGKTAIRIGGGDKKYKGGYLRLYNGNGNSISYLGISTPDGNGRFVLSDSKGNKRLELTTVDLGGYIETYNYQSEKVVSIGSIYHVDKRGHGLINIYDKYGENHKSYSFNN